MTTERDNVRRKTWPYEGKHLKNSFKYLFCLLIPDPFHTLLYRIPTITTSKFRRDHYHHRNCFLVILFLSTSFSNNYYFMWISSWTFVTEWLISCRIILLYKGRPFPYERLEFLLKDYAVVLAPIIPFVLRYKKG